MRPSVRRMTVVIAAVAALSVGTTGGDLTAAAKTAPVAVDVYVIGSTTGGIVPLLQQALPGVDAAVHAVNAKGKVKLDVTVCDAKGDINALRQCGQDAVAAKPDAILSSDVAQTAADFPETFQAAQIPVFWLLATGTAESEGDTAMRATSELATFGGAGYAAADLGYKKKAAVVYPAIAAANTKTIVAGYKGNGGKSVVEVQAPFAVPGANPPDYAPYAQKVADTNAQIALVNGLFMLQELRAAGFTAPVMINEGPGEPYNEQLRGMPDEITRDHYRVGGNPPFDLKHQLPSVVQFKKALKAADHPDLESVTPFGWNAWVSLNAIADVAAGMSNVTAASLLKTMNASPGIKLVSGETWVPSAKGPNAYPRQGLISVWIAKYVGDGKWKLVKTPPEGISVPPETFNSLQ